MIIVQMNSDKASIASSMWTIVASVFAGAFILVFYRFKQTQKRRLHLQSKVNKRIELRTKLISEIESKLDEVPLELRQLIASCSLNMLIHNLQIQKFSALQVLRTYQWKAIKSQHKTNCITEFIREADEWAKQLDQAITDPSYRRPPLFGVPFSIKECIRVCGYDQTKGYAQELDKPAKEDALIVQQIKELGGIPFVLTNVPQSLLSFSCTNPIYGITSNAFAIDRTSGGSSGGEGALIASHGSIIGIGSDVGGSIRFPCHFNGIAGIKPCHLRLSHQGSKGSVPGRPLINASDGPMAKNVSDIVTFLKTIWSSNWISQRDPYVPPVQWDEQQFSSNRPLRIWYYYDDGWFTPTPALQRAVRETVSKLESVGHTLVPFQPPRVSEAFQLFIGAVTVDAGQYLLSQIDSDLVCDGYGGILHAYRTPLLIQRFLAILIAHVYPRLAHMLRAMPYNTSELRSIYERIECYRDEFVHLMKLDNIDALVCPVQVIPAVGHHYPMQLFSTVSYCGLFNLLDFAAGTVRVTQVTEDDELALRNYPETDPWYKMAKQATTGSVGLPVGVQVAAPPYREETVLRILKLIEDEQTLETIDT